MWGRDSSPRWSPRSPQGLPILPHKTFCYPGADFRVTAPVQAYLVTYCGFVWLGLESCRAAKLKCRSIREEPSTEACKCTLPKETTLGLLDAGSSLWLVIGCHGPCRLSLIIDTLKFLNPLQAIFAHTQRFIQC